MTKENDESIDKINLKLPNGMTIDDINKILMED